MAQKKLKRFKEIGTFKNVFEKPEDMQGKWNSYFQNTNGITLELACGKGEYTINLAAIYPERNFIGIDIKGNRLWHGAKKAIEEGLNNAAFLRTYIDKLRSYFLKNEVEEIWITFPDPQLRNSRAKKRLTHPLFLSIYKTIIREQGAVNLKTDSPELYQFTKSVIKYFELTLLEDNNDVYRNEPPSTELKIKTHYEILDIAKSNTVFYLKFTLNDNVINQEKLLAFKELMIAKEDLWKMMN